MLMFQMLSAFAGRCTSARMFAALFVAAAPAHVFAKGGIPEDQVVIQFLASTGEDPDATARARWTEEGNGTTLFNVELRLLPAGSYALYVTDFDTPKASIDVDETGVGAIQFASPLNNPEPLLDFPVFGQQIEVRQGATVFFSDTFTAEAPGGDGTGDGDKTKVQINLVNVGTATDFDAHGQLTYDAKGTERTLGFEGGKLDTGLYVLLLDGVPVSEVAVPEDGQVDVLFKDPVEPGSTQLGFDPLGAQLDVSRDGIVILRGVLPAATGLTGVKPASSAKQGSKDLGKAKADSLQVDLLNSGALPGAVGTATLTQQGAGMQFDIAIGSVLTGDYVVRVDGAEVGTFPACNTGIAGLQFSPTPALGQQMLDFDVKGKLIEVSFDATVVLSTVFPVSVQAALGSFKKETFKPNKVKVNLVNGGADLDATGSVSWMQKGNGDQELRIDVADLPAGDYAIVVDGVASASMLSVSDKPSGKASLVFATTPKGSKVALDFDPLGATLQLRDSNLQVQLQTVIDVP